MVKMARKAGFIIMVFLYADFSNSFPQEDCPMIKVKPSIFCNATKDCPDGFSCCKYMMGKSACIPRNPTVCYINGKKVNYKGKYGLDKCVTCVCMGHNTLLCKTKLKC